MNRYSGWSDFTTLTNVKSFEMEEAVYEENYDFVTASGVKLRFASLTDQGAYDGDDHWEQTLIGDDGKKYTAVWDVPEEVEDLEYWAREERDGFSPSRIYPEGDPEKFLYCLLL